MMIETVRGVPMDARVLSNYLKNLVNCFFKILPIRENDEPTLQTYMESLQVEMIGCSELIVAIREDTLFMTLVSILQYLIDHPEVEVAVYRREVFKAISVCNKLKSRYTTLLAEGG